MSCLFVIIPDVPGVPQGSILGTLVFSLYTNDLPSTCPDTNTWIYADDTVIYVHGSSTTQAANELTNSRKPCWLFSCSVSLLMMIKLSFGMWRSSTGFHTGQCPNTCAHTFSMLLGCTVTHSQFGNSSWETLSKAVRKPVVSSAWTLDGIQWVVGPVYTVGMVHMFPRVPENLEFQSKMSQKPLNLPVKQLFIVFFMTYYTAAILITQIFQH